jgi:hypothetical protein
MDPFKGKNKDKWMISSTKSDTSKKRKKIIYILIVIVVVAFLSIVLVRPAIVGYSTYNKLSEQGYSGSSFVEDYMTSCEDQKIVSEQEIAACEQQKTDLTQSVDSLSEGKKTCEKSAANLKEELKDKETAYEEEIDELMDEVSTAKKELDDVEDEYDDFLEYAANNICCKQKVDDPSIKYYEVDDGKIVCREDEGKGIECFK